MRPRYSLRNGKLWNQFCEINVAQHCNLTCRSCSHLSPIMSKSLIDPDAVMRDLKLLSASYRAGGVKLLGGEPLLHPDLPAIAEAVRKSGVTDRIYVVTNGTLLPRMDGEFWRAVDEIWVSVYHGAELTAEELREVRARAREGAVRLRFRSFPRFRESFAIAGTEDDLLVKRIYDTCKIAQDWRCHTIANGYFYKCPKAYFIALTLGVRDGPASGHEAVNGIEITGAPGFREELRRYLESPEPLDACSRCLGTVGLTFAHEQVGRQGWLDRQRAATEDLVDMRMLRADELRMKLPSLVRKTMERLAGVV